MGLSVTSSAEGAIDPTGLYRASAESKRPKDGAFSR